MAIQNQELVLGDSGMVSIILAGLTCNTDRRSAALVCKVWNEAVRWSSSKLSLRSSSCTTSLQKLVLRFAHVLVLDLSWCSDSLQDSDLFLVSASFKYLKSLSLGHHLQPQEKITSLGLENVASGCGFLEDLTLSHLPNVQDQGIHAVCVSCKSLASLSLENCGGLTDGAFKFFPECHGLRGMYLKGSFRFTAAGLASGLGSCKGLVRVSLDLGFLEIDPALKEMASNCGKVEEVELRFRNAGLWSLASFTSLRKLSICSDQRSALDGAILDTVETNQKLVEITYMNSCIPLSDSTVIQIVMRCPRLRKLHLDALYLSEVVLTSIVHCKELEHLTLENYRSSGEGLAQLGLCGLPLRHFSLRSGHGIRDVEIQMLVHGKQLEHLNLQACTGLTSIGFSAIGSCSSLQHLDLSFTGVDDIDLSEIATGVKNLKSLTVVKCEAILSAHAVGVFTSLESLTLDQCSFVRDRSLSTIAERCKLLRCLSLAFTQVSDAGLTCLGKCSELRMLNVTYCRGVRSGEGIVKVVQDVGLHLAVVSHRFRDTRVVKVLKDYGCFVQLEVDDMALIPFEL